MSFVKKIYLLLMLLILFIPKVNAVEDKNLVNIYMFYSDSCMYCSLENKMFDELILKYDNIRIYKYEINDSNNMELFTKVSELYDIPLGGVPCIFIGDIVYNGFDKRESRIKYEGVIEYYSKYGYVDRIGEYLGNIELPKYEVEDSVISVFEYVDNYGNYKISFLGFDIETKGLSLYLISLVIGLIDGFNFYNLFILLFIIGILLVVKDKKKIINISIINIFIFLLLYLLFMLNLFNINNYLFFTKYLKIFIGLLFIIYSLFNIYRYNFVKCDKKIIGINKLEVIGFIIFTILISFNNIDYISNLSIKFMDILSFYNLSVIEYFIYIFIYMFCLCIVDLIVFFIVIRVIQKSKNMKILGLVGIIILNLLGLLIIFK